MLDWEENVFLGLKAVYKRVFVNPKKEQQKQVRQCLSDQRSKLLFLAQMIAGKSLSLFETDNKVLYAGDRIFLPVECFVGKTKEINNQLYELKTIVAALSIREQWYRDEVELAAALQDFIFEFPALNKRIQETDIALGDDTSIWDVFGALPLRSEVVETTISTGLEIGELDASEITTEIEGKGQVDVEVIAESEDDGEGADLAIHTFEKAETLEEQTGLSRKSDDEDELESHEEALEEVDMRQVVRSQERPLSIYRSDLILDGFNFDVKDNKSVPGIPYPEWNYKKRSYLPDWCFLNEVLDHRRNPDWVVKTEAKQAALVRQLKQQFASLTSEWLKLKRQANGNEFDLDAVVDSQVELRSGHTPSERIYTDQQRELHDISALLLLDLSYSTDAWLNDARVLDTILETVYCVGEVLDDYIESFAVAGFSSNTRRSCRFDLLKDFHEPWKDAKESLGTAKPEGYTRIGPALRHSQELLLNESAQRKIVILVTDGRPCDYDRYEGYYGIQDVKKAIETGKLNGISTHAFAIEKQAAESFPQMFNGHHFDVVSSPDKLTQTMCGLFARLIKG